MSKINHIRKLIVNGTSFFKPMFCNVCRSAISRNYNQQEYHLHNLQVVVDSLLSLLLQVFSMHQFLFWFTSVIRESRSRKFIFLIWRYFEFRNIIYITFLYSYIIQPRVSFIISKKWFPTDIRYFSIIHNFIIKFLLLNFLFHFVLYFIHFFYFFRETPLKIYTVSSTFCRKSFDAYFVIILSKLKVSSN